MGNATGGQLVARMLKKEGVKHVFTLSGLHVAPIYAGLVEEGIQVIDTRHEQAAAHAADAYARITRGIGAAALLAKAERPAVIAGSSIWWDGAWDALAAFCERAQVPVFLNGAGRGCLPNGHRMFFQHTRKDALNGADLVFVIGTPFDFRLN